MDRKYNLTFGQLIDRLCIVTLKSIKISENKETYEQEAQEIMHDLDLIVKQKKISLTGQMVRAIIVNAIANDTIWNNESEARKGNSNQDKLLKFTHSVNGVRTNAMNVISQEVGERKDLKLDCLAADVCKEKGYNWEGIL